jgi:hypothetical protein
MKKLWSDRRTFLSCIAIVGLLYIMDKQGKDYSLEVVALAGGIAMINAWEKVKGSNVEPKI